MALSSAAVLGVYAAGFVRTRAAAQRFAEADLRRTPVRAPAPLQPPVDSTPIQGPGASLSPVAPSKPAIATAQPPAAGPASVPTARDRKTPIAERSSRRTASAAATAPVLPRPGAVLTDAASVGATPAAPPPVAASVPVPDPAPAPVTAPGNPAAPAVQQPAAPAPPAAASAAATYKDGTYSGWGTSRHGDIQATVVIENGRIASASISQCYTRYPCSWIAALPPQVAQRQSPEVDFVSGATQSTNAFYYAVIEALSKAK